MATATQQKPVYATRHGRLDAAVWENQGEKSTFFNVSLKKSYKDGEEWKSTQASFGHDDTLGAAKLLGWADDAVQKALAQQEQFHGDKKPLASKKRGMLEVAVWQKQADEKIRYRVSLKRSYKDGDEWKSVIVWLLANDCLAAARVLTRAFDAIDSHVAASGSSFVETAKQTFDAEVTPPDEDIPF